MTLSDEQIQELLRVGNPTDEERRLIRIGWDAAMRTKCEPYGWLRAIDEALVVAHIGVANVTDSYAQAREKIDNLIGLHVDIATDPAVNGGWKLVPIEPTTEIRKAMHYAYWQSPQLPYHDGSPELWNSAYAAMLNAAPEVS